MADEREQELLWGLWRRRSGGAVSSMSAFPLVDSSGTADGQTRSWNLLRGLFGYEREGLRRSVRLLYWLRFGLGNEGAERAEEGMEP